MINYTKRLDNAIRISAWAHEQACQHRKGTDIPYIIHPFGVMLIASNVTNDEDILVSCLMHDVIEDVDSSIYSEDQLRADFGEKVFNIILGVTKDKAKKDWHEQTESYLENLKNNASDESLIVSIADKTHNLASILTDYEIYGDNLWQRFTTKSGDDQLWLFKSTYDIAISRGMPKELCETLLAKINELQSILN